MISFFRKAAQSKIVLALLALVLVAFVVTGIGNPLGGAPITTIAEVGDSSVTDTQLSNQFDRQLASIRQEQPEITAAQAVKGGALEGVLERLLGSQALIEMSNRLGLAASKRQVDAEIAAVPAFRGPDGRFSESTFRDILKSQGLEETAIRTEIGGDVVRKQLLALVDAPSATPRLLAEPYAALQLERRTLNIAAVPIQRFADVPAPTDADIETYYRQNIQRFTLPERREIAYALINRALIAPTVQVTEAALADYYKRNAKSFAAAERRTLSQVVVQERGQADTIAKRVNAGEDFASVAAAVAGFSASDLALGTLTKTELLGTVSQAVADAAFAAPSGKITAPVQSDFGWHVVRVDKVETQNARSLNDVRAEITPLVQREMVENTIADMVSKADELLADGSSVAEVAKDLGLAVVKLPPVTSEGITLGKTDVQLDASARPIIERAFAYGPEEEPVVEDISPDLHAIINVENVIAPTPLPLESLKARVAAQLTVERRLAAAKTMADKLVKDMRSGKQLPALLAENKLPPLQSITARRIELSRSGQPIPAPIALGFALPKGEIRPIAQPQNGAYFIVQVADVVPGNPADAPPLVDSLRSQLREAATGEIAQNFVAAIMADVGVKRYPEALARLKQRYTGSEIAQ